MGRSTLRLCCLVVLVAAGCRTSPPAESPPTIKAPSSTSPAVSAPPAEECVGIGPVPAGPAITYLSGSKLFQLSGAGARPACLVNAGRPLTLSWSPNGDQVLLGGLQTFTQTGERPLVPEQVRSPRWSAPTGKATIHISIDQNKLLKIPAGGGTPKDISFLKRHDEVVYHPAGTHIAVAGLAEDGHLGIFLAVNDGSDPQVLAQAESAESISSLAYDSSGETLFFAAQHDGVYHLHALHQREGLSTYAEGPQPIARIFPAVGSSGTVAFRQGACSEGTKTVVRRFGPPPVAEPGLIEVPAITRFVEPAGWTSDGKLLVIARQSGCEEPGDLYQWSEGAAPQLLASGVDRAAVRMAAQGPPPAPPIPGAGVA